jgi:hypothetical protein
MPGLRITDQDLVNEDAKAALIQRIGQDVQDLTVMTKLSGNHKIVKNRTTPIYRPSE